MIGLVVTCHGHFADGIHTSAQMIAGENDYVRYINFSAEFTLDSGISLLYRSAELRTSALITHCIVFAYDNALLCGFDIRHHYTSLQNLK